MEDKCISCGAIIPEGRQICPSCEKESSMYHALVLIKTHINRQNAEVKRLELLTQSLNLVIAELQKDCENTKAEAIKEFAERLHKGINDFRDKREMVMLPYTEAALLCIERKIDNLVKEMTEGGGEG